MKTIKITCMLLHTHKNTMLRWIWVSPRHTLLLVKSVQLAFQSRHGLFLKIIIIQNVMNVTNHITYHMKVWRNSYSARVLCPPQLFHALTLTHALTHAMNLRLTVLVKRTIILTLTNTQINYIRPMKVHWLHSLSHKISRSLPSQLFQTFHVAQKRMILLLRRV